MLFGLLNIWFDDDFYGFELLTIEHNNFSKTRALFGFQCSSGKLRALSVFWFILVQAHDPGRVVV